MNILIALAILIVLVLAGYAAWLHFHLWKKGSQKRTSAPSAKQYDSHRGTVELRKSIFLIADAFLDDKMTVTEACLRICALANHLSEAEAFRAQHGVLFHVAASTSHIPILDAWQALPSEKQRAFNKERRAIEQTYSKAVIESVTLIKQQLS